MNQPSFNKYIIFWMSQSLSELGSAMTGYALILWAYQQTNSAMSVSLMSFCSYMPFILVSIFTGSFIDSHKKKSILLWSDTLAALCTGLICILSVNGKLEIFHIYLVNLFLGLMNSFQSPALSVAIGILVPETYRSRASGMSSFSTNLITVITPMAATALYTFLGLEGILFLDLLSFILAASVLLLWIPIPEVLQKVPSKDKVFDGFLTGWAYLLKNRGILYLMLSMAVLNFFSRLTYENILTPMLLSRSQNSTTAGIVTGILGAGGIFGGLLVSLIKLPRNNQKVMYSCAALSFLLGDFTMGIGRNLYIWSLAAIFASLPIPFIGAAQNVILYRHIPSVLQGRIFAVRNALQYSTIPIGILLGGFLADYVFEPFMASHAPLAKALGRLTGNTPGSGMAVMFLCTGILGFFFSILWLRNREIKKISQTAE